MVEQIVCIDLYPDAGTGAYAVEVQAGPKDRASADDLPARSGDLWLDLNDLPVKPTAHRLLFTPVVPGPFGTEPLTQPQRLLCAYLYHARDEPAILSMSERIMDGYARFYATRGVYYAGVFRVTGPSGPCLAELMAYDAPDRQEAHRIGGENLPEFITTIDDEYHLLMDLESPRYIIWLSRHPSTK